MRLTFRTDNLSDYDDIGLATGRIREKRVRTKWGTGVQVLVEVQLPKRNKSLRVWWPEELCDTFDAPGWRLDDHGALIHSPTPMPTPIIPKRSIHQPGRSKQVAPALHRLVEEHCTRPTLHTVSRLKLFADTLLDDETGTSPKVVPVPKAIAPRDQCNDRLRGAAHALVHDSCSANYFTFLELAWMAYAAAERTLTAAREVTPTLDKNLHRLYKRFPHRTQFASSDDPRVPGAYQWPNPAEPDKSLDRYRAKGTRRRPR